MATSKSTTLAKGKKAAHNAKKAAERAKTKGTLSPTDIHYIAGFLFQWAGGVNPKETDITFGEMLFDPKAKVDRDVDVVIFRLRDHIMVGVEVKDHTRALQLEQVEQLVFKLIKIPDLKERAIISASGYSEAALNVADSYGVKCLQLVRGTPPAYDTTDFSKLKQMDHEGFRWSKPTFSLNVGGTWLHSGFDAKNKVTVSKDGKSSVAPLATWLNTACVQSARNWTGPLNQRTTQIVEFSERPSIHLAHGSYELRQAAITGVVTPFKGATPIEATCYLADRTGKPFAHLILFDVGGTLMGIGSSEGDYHVKFVTLPAELRAVRPKKVKF